MKVIVVLGLGGTSHAQLVIDADHYIQNMTGNTLFTAPDVVAQVTLTASSLGDYRAALNAPTSSTKTDTINATREVLERNLTILGNKVESLANDPSMVDDKRIGVVHSAGMNVKGQGATQKRVFSVKNAAVAGTVHLTAEGGAKAHEWQYSVDVQNFTGKIAANTTTTASTDIGGLKSGSRYAFFHKAIMAGMATDWEGPLFVNVL
jgi:hypothetical protein